MTSETTLPYYTANIVFAVDIGETIDTTTFALNNWGCVLHNSSAKRIMYYSCANSDSSDVKFSMNIFNNGKINVFTNDISNKDIIVQNIKKMFNVRDLTIRVVNMTVVFEPGYNLDLDDICQEDFKDDALFDLSQSQSDKSNVKNLDRQLFSALFTLPFRDSNMSLNVFDSGKFVACGLKSMHDINRMSKYIVEEYGQK